MKINESEKKNGNAVDIRERGREKSMKGIRDSIFL